MHGISRCIKESYIDCNFKQGGLSNREVRNGEGSTG